MGSLPGVGASIGAVSFALFFLNVVLWHVKNTFSVAFTTLDDEPSILWRMLLFFTLLWFVSVGNIMLYNYYDCFMEWLVCKWWWPFTSVEGDTCGSQNTCPWTIKEYNEESTELDPKASVHVLRSCVLTEYTVTRGCLVNVFVNQGKSTALLRADDSSDMFQDALGDRYTHAILQPGQSTTMVYVQPDYVQTAVGVSFQNLTN